MTFLWFKWEKGGFELNHAVIGDDNIIVDGFHYGNGPI